MSIRRWLVLVLTVSVWPSVAAAAVLESLAPFLVNHYTFDNPLGGDPLSNVEVDLGSDLTNIQLLNGAPRVADGAWWGSAYSLETRQNNDAENDDWKAGIMFGSSAESTLAGTASATGITLMGWFKPLGGRSNNPSPNTNSEDPDDYYNAFGLAGYLRGDEDLDDLDGHTVRALLEVIGGKVKALGRRLDSQVFSGSRASDDDWHVVMPPETWTHLTATFDFNRGRIQLYKNGALLESSSSGIGNWETTPGTDYTSDSNAGGIKIGGSYPDNSEEKNPFNGRTDELMFFNKSLTPGEVAAQFALVSDTPGDFNHDGRVDAADYTVWRDGLDSLYDGDDYNDWKMNFGQSPGTGPGSALVLVPEPTTAMLAFAALILALALRRQQTL
jgi:hypothetical protein